ncbi:hypothetical protein TPAR_00357 [Tolypocladium paradoxum]|uniref:Uncharacterized protein n=1 Tax=Tolypocladium paradoxum TaxID=94208 RepID=A0A2S4LAI0_9HYPO|nr:hypothetical protein TPAR_00357 [Tolypocladium paradoxum]
MKTDRKSRMRAPEAACKIQDPAEALQEWRLRREWLPNPHLPVVFCVPVYRRLGGIAFRPASS